MRNLSAVILAAAMAAVAPPALAKKAESSAAAAKVDPSATPSGVYTPDPVHRHIYFSYLHQGYSASWVRWRDWTGELTWNAEQPDKSSVKVTIDAAKIDTGFDVFDGHMKGEKFFDVAQHPTITFASTSVKQKGANRGVIVGDLTIKGVTKPVTLDVTFNKGAFEERAKAPKLGFSGKAVLKRSDWGLDAAIPFVGDEVTVVIEAEFYGPPTAAPAGQ
ncbi:MAG: YceI family protein [Parvularculaceae bacterium]|jgi:polyisoprenoid-binding protein YceI|nr:YceI family protein [Parvularculaceae bacterium]